MVGVKNRKLRFGREQAVSGVEAVIALELRIDPARPRRL
jgi:hypothetical protein